MTIFFGVNGLYVVSHCFVLCCLVDVGTNLRATVEAICFCTKLSL